jgi:hypothetical protein
VATKPLHTFVALRDGTKNRKTEQLTVLHRDAVKPNLYEGMTRTYRPRTDDGDQLPGENQNVQLNVDTVLNALVQSVSRDWNLMATVETGNQSARADVLVATGETTPAGEPVYRTVLRNVPAAYLLFIARELDDVYTFVKKLPTLDPGARWTYDEAVAAYVSEPVETHRTKKVLRNHVKYEATDRHPAQVEVFSEDVVVGFWTAVRRSGALTLERKAELLQRVDALRLAVREARERANTTDVDDVDVARPLFDYLLGGS